MGTKKLAIELLLKRQDVIPYVRQVVEAAESDRAALGWFPFKVFEEAAISEKLIVTLAREGDQVSYAGHLLFATTFPRGHIMQIHVSSSYRRQGVAKKQLDFLKSHLAGLNYISIGARVAEDLRMSQEFWQSQDFYAHGTTPGGKTRGRTLVLRSHELPTQQLFATSGLTHRDPLGLAVDPATATKLYLLDLNVLFDLGPRRARHQDVVDLFALERLGVCRLALSTEFDAELARSATSGKTDPMQGLGQIFPKFAAPSGDDWDQFVKEIGPMVFPERHAAEKLTKNDLSDLRHLATVIHHNLAGLVTSDGSIRDAAAMLRIRYGIEVLSPAAFKILGELDSGIGAITASTRVTLDLEELASGQEQGVRALLTDLGVSVSGQSSHWAADDGRNRACHRYIVLEGPRVIGYLMWPSSFRGSTCDAFIAIDESSACAKDAARLMIVHLTGRAKEQVQRVRLNLAPQQASVREIALEVGFTGTDKTQELNKVSLNGVLVPENWAALRAELLKVSEIGLPKAMPTFRDADQYFELQRPDGQRTQLTTFALETLLSPALICMAGRPGVLVPIQRDYSEHLLDHLDQMQLLPHGKALLYQQRHYLSAPRTLKVFQRGSLMLFYESNKGKGLKAVVAIARVINAYLSSEGAVERADLERSALEPSDLVAIGKSETKAVVVFDNLMKLPHPVPLESLRRFGCGQATQLLTSRPLTPDQIRNILLEGLQHERSAERPDLS
ncbi:MULTISPECIES: GNAT family N-acetyltransferase [unclassified Variovorax]|uniref:GNAT family N-acetyltransferase n=1 Tax=unclassified Variovorax TaxID=663243 RepID=UPI0008C8DDF3|nr:MULTISPECIES: GNAT family N-acetyltransferase [unclassified Variovorax]SEK13438.1 Ribosomal protein S18 acetylase RimI [Variovorax sp. OK202]SFD85324.1 Ribosomal protein S18 acetylase RimI [Variovorax sp. OK212]